MCTIDAISDEILEHFLEQYFKLRPKVLVSAALVSRRWRGPAQVVLFRPLELKGSRQAQKRLNSPARQQFQPKSVSMGMHFVGWPAVVEACEGITTLEVGLFPYEVLLSPALARLWLTIFFPGIVHLII